MKWANGVAVEYSGTRVILDPQVNSSEYPNVFITHAHYDHAKGFHFPNQTKFSTKETYDLVRAIKKKSIRNWNPVLYGRKVKIDDLEIKPHNAGHVLGSVQYEVISPEGNLVYTGDLNFVDTLTMKAAEACPCDILVIETTFGSPGFVLPPKERIYVEIAQWAFDSIKSQKTPAFQTDSIGNAQELIRIFNTLTTFSVITHWKVTRINKVYESYGHALNYLDAGAEEASELASSCKRVFIAPKRLNLSGNSDFNVAYVSGWASRLKGGRKPFLLSDHADFSHLLQFVKECGPKMVLTCHGGRFNEIFAKYVTEKLGIEARPLRLIPTKIISE